MTLASNPTERELEILKILWERGEASVRDVYEQMRETAPIVQNTVQAFLRTMEEKGLVRHRVDGRTFVYKPVAPREQTTRKLTTQFVEHVFDGAIDQLIRRFGYHGTPTTIQAVADHPELAANLSALKAGRITLARIP